MKKNLTALTIGMIVAFSGLTAANAAPVVAEAVPPIAGAKIITTDNLQSTKNSDNNVGAKPAISMEKAQQTAEKLFQIPAGFKRESVNYEDIQGRKAWTFVFTKNISNNYARISFSLDADTGEVRYYNNDDSYMWEGKDSFSTDFTREEAHQKALAYLKKFAPAKISLLKEIDVPEYNDYMYGKRPVKRYTFRFVRLINGIPYEEDGIWLNIIETGQLVSYNMNWTNLPENLPLPKIQFNEAKKIFSDKIGFKLTYNKEIDKRPPYDSNASGKARLVYQIPDYMNFYIDAETGEVKDYSGIIMTAEYLKSAKTAPAPNGDEKFYIGNAKVAKEDVDKIIADNELVPEGFISSTTEFRKDYFSNRDIWYRSYTKKDAPKDTFSNLQIGVAADNGEIIELHKFKDVPYTPQDKDTKTLTYTEARRIAEDFLQKIAPGKVNVVKLDPQPQMLMGKIDIMYQPPEYYFHFTRYVNGAAVSGEGININVDAISGEITHYRQDFTVSYIFPKVNNIIPENKILEQFFAKPNLQLSYFRIYQPIYYGAVTDGVYIKLGYRLTENAERYFDAVTGKPLYFNYQKPVEKPVIPTDIVKSKYNQAIKKMVDLKIMGGRLKGKFYPDVKITQAEFIKALVVARGFQPIYDSSRLPYKNVSASAWYAPYLRAALSKGILTASDKLTPNAPLSKEEAAVYAIRALGYDKIAQFKIYKKPAQRGITKERIGFAALAEGFNFFPEKKATYQESITRGESAQIILNLLKINNQ